MDRLKSVVCVCETHEEAERAMYNLQAAPIDIGTLSIATKDLASDEHKVDYYDLGEQTFAIPGIGPLLVSGPLASWIVAAFNDVATLKGVSILGAALSAVGIAHDSILKYEAALRTDKYLLVVHGSPAAVASALAAIGGTVHCFQTVHGEKVLGTRRGLSSEAQPASTYQA